MLINNQTFFSFIYLTGLILGLYCKNDVQVLDTRPIVRVWPIEGDSVRFLYEGAELFSDHLFKIDKIPDILKGSHFLFSNVNDMKNLIPVAEGYLYVATPEPPHPKSKINELQNLEFISLGVSFITFYECEIINWQLFSRPVRFDRFRLENIELEGWILPFFIYDSLPSLTEKAQLLLEPELEYSIENRLWQGCPSIEITGKKMWAAWFSGGSREPDHGNYGIISTSSDNGKSWDDPTMVITHPDENVRVMDTQLWKDPLGRLWIMWVQNTGSKGFDGIWGTWGMYTENPENPNPKWSQPQRLCDGLTRNKPLVLSSGEWLLPSYDWIHYQSTIYLSDDHGATWRKQGGPVNEKIQNFYEHMCVELSDGRIWMLQRNIQQSFSKDKGKTWTDLEPLPGFNSANSRLYIGRLHSGNLILVFNDDEAKQRRNMTAYLSTDEGHSWPHKLVIDERDEVSYPELVQNDDGLIYLVYDRSRTGEKEILMAVFNENDVVAGKFQSGNALQKHLISKGLGKL